MNMATDLSPNSMGRVVQVIGPVVDVAFDDCADAFRNINTVDELAAASSGT